MARSPASTLRKLTSLLAAAALSSGTPATAQPSEAAVKAAFLSKFAAYVSWPQQAQPASGEPLVLCIIGPDPFGRLVDDACRGQLVDGHPLAVKRLQHPDPGAGCNLAFVGAGTMLETMKGKPILTVTDARSSVQRGMIHFVVNDGRVRFHIDEALATRSGLTISSRLLALALSVRQR